MRSCQNTRTFAREYGWNSQEYNSAGELDRSKEVVFPFVLQFRVNPEVHNRWMRYVRHRKGHPGGRVPRNPAEFDKNVSGADTSQSGERCV